MKRNPTEAKLLQVLELNGLAGATPSLQIQAYKNGRRRVDFQWGKNWHLFDWASLTKVVFSMSSMMIAVEDRALTLNDRLTEWIPEVGDLPYLLRTVASHSAGFEWWKPFYERVGQARSPGEAWPILIDDVIRSVKAHHAGTSKRETKAVYSDLDFFIIGEVLLRATLVSFGERWLSVADRLGLKETLFHATRKSWAEPGVVWSPKRQLQSAPTERDPRRVPSGDCLQGFAHDENTWALGGAAPHAGLFGPIDDLSRYGLELRKLARGERSKLPTNGRTFLKRAVARKQGDWALGFMLPSKGSASCGPLFSSTSVGHLGFTGTSLWYDPKADLLVIVLANRVSPTRENKSFNFLRPIIHTELYRLLD